MSMIVLSATAVHAQDRHEWISIDVINGTRPPAPNEQRLMRKEEEAHPNITKSMHDIQDAINHLNAAPDNFGGHKGRAISDLQQAYVSLRKALYFRLYQERH